jgi:DNA-binding SARP family transcriptional activator
MPGRLALLGGAVFGDRTDGAPLPADRRGCLLAYLAVDGGWVDRDRLALLFWPDADEAGAKRNLRQLLLRVRRLSLDPPLEATPAALRWRVDTDVASFRRALAEGDHAAAVALYDGPFLEGFAVADVGGIDVWLEAERDQLHAAYHGAVLREAAAALASGRFADAAAGLGRLLELDPLAEDVVEAHVRALYLAGRREPALAAYERFAAALSDELGLAPLDATRRLADAVRRGEPVALPEAPAPRPGAAAPRRLEPTRLVARDAERAALLTARSAAVVVAGEPGIGKSALLRELLPDALWCGASEGLERLPYHPLAQLVRRRPELAAGLGPYREDLARLVPEVAPGLAPGPVEPEAVRGRLVEAIARFVVAGGGVLAIDDLQWADDATLETVVYLARRGTRVYGAYRTGEAGPALVDALGALRAAGALTEVPVAPLPAEGVRSLIADLMGRAEGPPTFAQEMWRRSGGNPLFLLETLRSLFEGGVLRADAVGWHTDVDEATRDYSELQVPPRVSEVIAHRLARLDARTVRLLEVLAVAQAPLEPRALARVTGVSVAALAEASDEAERAGFLAGAGFRHDLLRQCIDDRLEPGRRRLLHRRLAETLGDGAGAGVLAEHWWRAGEPARARAAWLDQAATLRGRGLQTDAIATLQAALVRLPAGEDADWLRLGLADAAREAGRGELADALVETVHADGAIEARPPALRLRAALARATSAFQRSVAEARALLEEALPLASLVDDDDLALEVVLFRARIAKELLAHDEAIALLEPAVARLRRARPDLRLVQFLSSLAAIYDESGRTAEALPLHREALALAKALGSRYYQVEVSINLVWCYADLGRYDEAIARGEEALALGEYDSGPLLRVNLAANYFQAGRYEEALRHYQLLAEPPTQAYLRVVALARCAEAHALLGRTEAVGPLLERTLELLPDTDYPVAIGAAAIALLRFGDDAQVARLRGLVPDLDPARLPPHQRERLEAALAARGPTDGGRPA